MDQPATQRRSGFRFSLKTLLLAVVPVAIGAAALLGWLGGCFAQFLAWPQRRTAGNASPQ